MTKALIGGRVRRDVVVPESAVYSAIAAIAAAIEEPYCILGKDELQGLVRAHGRLAEAVGSAQRDYSFRDGAVFASRGGTWIKCGLQIENPFALDSGEPDQDDAANDGGISHAKRLGVTDEVLDTLAHLSALSYDEDGLDIPASAPLTAPLPTCAPPVLVRLCSGRGK